jgi:hypothetical protein
MTENDGIERLIASMASGERVDWSAARRLAATDEDQRIDAGRNRADRRLQPRPVGTLEPLLEHARHETAELEAAVRLDTRDAADLRRALGARTAVGTIRPTTPSIELLAGHDRPLPEAPIGEGGMGTVWLARRDGRSEARVAVKLLHLPRVDDGLGTLPARRSDPARLHHPNIAQLIDAGVTPAGQPYRARARRWH